MIQFNAHFDGKVLMPDEPVNLPVGTRLHVTIDAEPDSGAVDGVLERLSRLAESCAVEGPPDLARRHDYYAHANQG